jgi:hypothetical protein
MELPGGPQLLIIRVDERSPASHVLGEPRLGHRETTSSSIGSSTICRKCTKHCLSILQLHSLGFCYNARRLVGFEASDARLQG